MSKRANKNQIRTEKLYTPWHKPMIITIKPEAYKLNKITNQHKKVKSGLWQECYANFAKTLNKKGR